MLVCGPMSAGERGFTVIEVMMAIVILRVGILGLTSTAAAVVQMIGSGQRFTEASELAAEHLETMRTLPCAQLADSSTSRNRFAVAWTIAPIAGGEGRRIDLTVVSPTPRGRRAHHFSMSVSCRV